MARVAGHHLRPRGRRDLQPAQARPTGLARGAARLLLRARGGRGRARPVLDRHALLPPPASHRSVVRVRRVSQLLPDAADLPPVRPGRHRQPDRPGIHLSTTGADRARGQLDDPPALRRAQLHELGGPARVRALRHGRGAVRVGRRRAVRRHRCRTAAAGRHQPEAGRAAQRHLHRGLRAAHLRVDHVGAHAAGRAGPAGARGRGPVHRMRDSRARPPFHGAVLGRRGLRAHAGRVNFFFTARRGPRARERGLAARRCGLEPAAAATRSRRTPAASRSRGRAAVPSVYR